jgi:hypothetical protein
MEYQLLNKIFKEAEKAHEPTLLDHFEVIMKGDSKAEASIRVVSETLEITPVQAAVFAHFLNRCNDQPISMEEVAKSLKCSAIQMLKLADDIDMLVQRRFLRPVGSLRDTGTDAMPTYRISSDVINAVRQGKAFVPPDCGNLSLEDFVDTLDMLFEKLDDDDISYNDFSMELDDLLQGNSQLALVKHLRALDLEETRQKLLLFFCRAFACKDDAEYTFAGIERCFGRFFVRRMERSFKTGKDVLFEKGLVEAGGKEGFSDAETYRLTAKAKELLLGELHREKVRSKADKNLLFPGRIVGKKLFYNETVAAKVDRLTDLLQQRNFAQVTTRLREGGTRRGFACLFYGPPGTGKTETALQIARATGRPVMQVDIADAKSKWYGESEKQMKAIFDRYRHLVGWARKEKHRLPILLFNEADALIGRRMEFGDRARSVDQTSNALQNIILQEIENLEGILIATTNLTCNMDAAFERRFLYKIEFENPTDEVRRAIWQSLMSDLDEKDAVILSQRFDFSGGQIENVARKRTVERILTGGEVPLDTLIGFCKDETLATERKTIGFGA